MECWGNNDYGQLGQGETSRHLFPVKVPNDKKWIFVSVGSYHSCAIDEDKKLYCWGRNNNNQIGGAASSFISEPKLIGENSLWKSASAGAFHSCAVKDEGSLWCWGSNGKGQLGIGSKDTKTEPTQVGTDLTWSTVSSRKEHTCAIKSGELYCWGSNYSAQLGIGNPFPDKVNVTTPAQVGTDNDWAEISTAIANSCAIKTDGTLWCWGDNYYGQLGNFGSAIETPLKIDENVGWESVSVGDIHLCAVKSGELYCKGKNEYAVLGTGSANFDLTEKEFQKLDGKWQSVSSSAFYNCAIGEEGDLSCWGANWSDLLSTGFINAKPNPVTGENSEWKSVFAGEYHVCGIKNNGSLWCWGDNFFGQLGSTGKGSSITNPAQIGAETTWTEMALGSRFSCGLQADKTVWCWGSNLFGQTGTGDNSDVLVPKKVEIENVKQIKAASSHVCALTFSDEIYCWGDATQGALGVTDKLADIATIDYCGKKELQDQNGNPVTVQYCNKPKKIGATEKWKNISTKGFHTCAINDKSELFCWGLNNYGQIGNGEKGESILLPLKIGSASNWQNITATFFHTCALDNTNHLWCWGTNVSKQLMNDEVDEYLVPTKVF